MKSIFTEEEYSAVLLDTLRDGKKQPMHRNISATQLSIARHYGGMQLNGELYTYFPATDELVSEYALKALKALRKAKSDLTAISEPKLEQMDLI